MHLQTSCLFLLTVVIVLSIHHRNSVSARSVRYTNYYSDRNIDVPIAENLLELGAGSINFLREDQYLLDRAIPETTPSRYAKYDFVIVGAGSAGSVIASRLSEIEDVKVLLIEAGPDETLVMDVPIVAPYLQIPDEINWKYQTEPSDRYCLGMTGKKCNWPRGKVMGGSSVLNFMIATRGSPKDYDRWAEMGNNGWAFKDVFKYFMKLENIEVPELRNDTEYHHTGGPMSIGYSPFHFPVTTAFLKGGEELGFPVVDYNGENMIGFSYLQLTTHRGYRVSSNKAYLWGKRRRNLHVTKMSTVTKILIDPETKRAQAVQFDKNGESYTVYAKKEIILSAGTIGSPQILMLSGIGPAAHLKKLGIEVLKDAPVGNNLMDHIAYGTLIFTVDQPVTAGIRYFADVTKPYVADFLLRHDGPMTIPGGCDALAFLDVDDPKNKKDGSPNIELLFIAASPFSDTVTANGMGFNERIMRDYAELRTRHNFGVFPLLLQPKSRGWIRLRSKNPYDKPIIVPNYLGHPEDIRVLIKGIRSTIRVSETKAMQDFGTKLYAMNFPECANYTFDSDDYWLCCIRVATINIYHYSGTCKMGPKSDKTAVVDPRLKVIGIEGLRVADASIMPNIISGHTNVPTLMIGEKLADMVKEDWGYATDTGGY